MRLDDVCQLYPSRLTITSPRMKKTTQSLVDSYIRKKQAKESIGTYKENFKKLKTDFNLSKSSKRKIFDSINAMYSLSPKRNIKMQNGKTLYNFQLAFITLTLPSTQAHTDTEIKSLCLNQFLFEIKRKYNISNFVWKAELQKNDNIHFHLIFDKYIDYQALRRRWNRIINKLGYVDAFRDKMKNLSLIDYHKSRLKYKECTFKESAEAYAKGKSSNWSNPNSVDVRSVLNKKDLAVYLSKYFAKNDDKEELTESEQERLINFGRIWSRSYTLVKLKFQNKYLVSEILDIINYLEQKKDKVFKLVGDYFTVYYFNVKELSFSFRKFHSTFMYAIAKIYRYPIPEG